MRLEAMCMTTWLSQKTIIGVMHEQPRLARRPLSHTSSHVVEAITRYSTSKQERVTTYCFLLFYKTRLLPANI